MADDLQNKLNTILNNPEMMKTISELAGSLGGNSSAGSSAESGGGAQSSGISDAAISNLQSALAGINDSSDTRINLLNALRPYMRTSRASNMDMAIKLLKLTKLTALLKDI